jgi:hypothetical protein
VRVPFTTPTTIPLVIELEPRRRRDDIVDLFVDLAATQEDHVEVKCISMIYSHLVYQRCIRQATKRTPPCNPGSNAVLYL